MSKSQSKKEIMKKQIETVFKKIEPAEKLFAPSQPVIPEQNPSDRWIIAGGSSKPNNKLIQVSTWQIGQAF